MNRWYLDENDIDIYLKCTDDVRWHYNKKELVRILNDLETKLADSEENNKLLEMQLQDMERSKLSWENQYFTLYNTLKNYREDTEKKHLLDEKEWQDYCAFKHIEPQIKGCLDREKEYEKQLAEKEKVIEWQTSKIAELNDYSQALKDDLSEFQDKVQFEDQDKISFAVERLEKVKEELEFTSNNNEWIAARDDRILNGICNFIDNQIKAIKEMK